MFIDTCDINPLLTCAAKVMVEDNELDEARYSNREIAAYI
jgi:hypothetical protein